MSSRPSLPGGHDSVLDVGCRDRIWNRGFDDTVRPTSATPDWTSAQNEAHSVDVVCDVALGMPFGDSTYDAGGRADVLEHIDDLHGALDELIRVAGHTVFVVLPNMAHVLHRVRFA